MPAIPHASAPAAPMGEDRSPAWRDKIYAKAVAQPAYEPRWSADAARELRISPSRGILELTGRTTGRGRRPRRALIRTACGLRAMAEQVPLFDLFVEHDFHRLTRVDRYGLPFARFAPFDPSFVHGFAVAYAIFLRRPKETRYSPGEASGIVCEVVANELTTSPFEPSFPT